MIGVARRARKSYSRFDYAERSSIHYCSKLVFSSFGASGYSDRDEWKAAVNGSNVRLQWDPDHLPTGDKCERRAVQLGLRGESLEAFGKREAVEILDVSDFVAEQREQIGDWKSGSLMTPSERVYRPVVLEAAENVGLDLAD